MHGKKIVPMKEYQQEAITSDSDFKDIEKQDINDLIREKSLLYLSNIETLFSVYIMEICP